jgi:hypothetical protein
LAIAVRHQSAGAITGAFGYLFNCSLHDGPCSKAEIDKKVDGCRGTKCFAEAIADYKEAGLLNRPLMGDVLGDVGKVAAFGASAGVGAAAMPLLADAATLRLATWNLGRVAAEAPEFAMLGRYASGLRSTWDKAFARHEASEFLMSFSGAAQPTLHRWALTLGGITTGPMSQYFLYHPSVVQKFPDFFNSATRAAAGVK